MKRCLRFFVLIFALSVSVVLRADTDAEVRRAKTLSSLPAHLEMTGSRFETDIGAACSSRTIMP